MRRVLILFSALITACNQNKYVEKTYNDPAKILNIQNLDTNSLYTCLSPDTYKSVVIELDSNIVYEDSNFSVDFVPAKLVYSQKKVSKNLHIHVKIDGIIDTTFNQNLIGVNKLMMGIVNKKTFYYRTNLEPMAWIVD